MLWYVDRKEHMSGYVFDISVRKADGFMLGLCCKERDTVLSVEAMQPQVLLHRWTSIVVASPSERCTQGTWSSRSTMCVAIQPWWYRNVSRRGWLRWLWFVHQRFHSMPPRMDSKAWKVEKGPVSDASKAILRGVETLLCARLILVWAVAKNPTCLSHLKLEFWSQMFVNGVPQQMFMNDVCVIPRCKDQLGLQKPRYLPQQCLKPRLQRPQINVIHRRWRYLPQQCSRHIQKCKVRHS